MMMLDCFRFSVGQPAAGARQTRLLGWPSPLWLCLLSLLAAVLLSAPAQAAGTRRMALVIGNDTYQKIPVLVNARSDARVMAESLRKVNYEVTLALDQDYRSMLNTLRQFKAAVNGGDEVVVFFSGHGVQLGAANYLLPIDMNPDSEEQVKDEAIPLQRVLDDLSERRARFTLAVIDACRNNPFKSHGRAIGGSRGLAPTSAATGQMVIFSAGTGQEALDSLSDKDPVKNGVFTRVFAKEMLTPDVPIDRVLKNVRLQVRDMAASVGREQVPAIYDQVAGDFFFVQSTGNAPVNLAVAQRPAPAAAPTTPVQAPAPVPAAAPVQQTAAVTSRPRAPEAATRPAAPSGADKSEDDLVNIWNQISSSTTPDDARRSLRRPNERPTERPTDRPDTASGRAMQGSGSATEAVAQLLSAQDVEASPTLSRIKAAGSIALGVRDDAPPLSFATAPGRFTGYQVELCLRFVEALRQSLGMAKLDVRFQPVTPVSLIPMVLEGRVDLECGATVNAASRQQFLSFGPTTYVAEARIVVKAASRITGLAQLSGKRLITVAGGTPGSALRLHPETASLRFDEVAGGDSAQTFTLMDVGAADAMLMDGPTAAQFIAKAREPATWRMLEPVLAQEPIAMVMGREDAGFKAAVDQIMGRVLRGDEPQRLYAQWFRGPGAAASRSTLAAWAEPNDRPAASQQR